MAIGALHKLLDRLPGLPTPSLRGGMPEMPGPMLPGGKGGPSPGLSDGLPPGIVRQMADGGMDVLPPGLARQLANGVPNSTPLPTPTPTPTQPGPPASSTLPATTPTTPTTTPALPSASTPGRFAPVLDSAIAGLLRGNPALGQAMNAALSRGMDSPQRAFMTPMLSPQAAPPSARTVAPLGMTAPLSSSTAQATAVPTASAGALPAAQASSTPAPTPGAPAATPASTGMTGTTRAPAEAPLPAQVRADIATLRPVANPPSLLAMPPSPPNPVALPLALAAVPLAAMPATAPMAAADPHGLTLIANERAAMVRTDALAPPGHTVEGTRPSWRRRGRVAQATMMQWFQAMGLGTHATHGWSARDGVGNTWLSTQWLACLLAVIAYGCVAVALVAFLGPHGSAAGNGSGAGWSGGLALGIGLVSSLGAWWLARRAGRDGRGVMGDGRR